MLLTAPVRTKWTSPGIDRQVATPTAFLRRSFGHLVPQVRAEHGAGPTPCFGPCLHPLGHRQPALASQSLDCRSMLRSSWKTIARFHVVLSNSPSAFTFAVRLTLRQLLSCERLPVLSGTCDGRFSLANALRFTSSPVRAAMRQQNATTSRRRKMEAKPRRRLRITPRNTKLAGASACWPALWISLPDQIPKVSEPAPAEVRQDRACPVAVRIEKSSHHTSVHRGRARANR